MKKSYFCIDVGGTFLKYAMIDAQGILQSQGKVETPHTDADGFVETLAQLVPDSVLGIGICFPGFIDSENGICKSCGTLEWLPDNFPLAKILEEKVGVPVTVENDARCACMAEVWNGALQDIHDGAVMVLGTAVGTGLILNGSMYYGSLGKAGEIGYNRSKKHEYWGYACSVPWLCREAAETCEVQEMTGEELMNRYSKGDPDICPLVEEYLNTLSEGIFSMQNLLDLERIAIGGGISRNTVFMEALQRQLHALYSAIPYQLHEPEIKACIHGNDANLIGAFYFHLLKMEEEHHVL